MMTIQFQLPCTFEKNEFYVSISKICGILNLKICRQFFSLFYEHLSRIPALGANIAEFGFKGCVFKSQSHLFFLVGKNVGNTKI